MRLRVPDFSKPNVRFRMLLYAGALAIFILFFVAAAFPLASNPTFCGKVCHSQNPEYVSWQKSSHAKVTCYACHINPTYSHLFQDKLTAGPIGIVDTLLDSYEKPINAESHYSQENVPSERCLRCHDPSNRNFTPDLEIGLNATSEMHIKHLDSGLVCTTCHNRVAHLGAGKYEPLKTWKPGFKYKNFMTMREGCWRCHSEDEKYRDEETLAKVGDKVPPTNCNTCHGKLQPETGKYNHNDVEGVPWKDGKLRHGKLAKEDFSVCLACHEKTSDEKSGSEVPNCTTTCHKGVTMPHKTPTLAKFYKDEPDVPEWLQVHPEKADELGVSDGVNYKINDPNVTCSMCHNKDGASDNFCQSCHHSRFDEHGAPSSSWKERHPTVVEEIGSSKCQKCHLLEFCAYCHTNGTKPARGTFYNRRTVPVPTDAKDLESIRKQGSN